MQSPNSIIKDLYLEITNIAQGVNVAIFVYVLTTPEFSASITTSRFSTVLIALTSLLIVIIFWARYYLDTVILDRSFTMLSVTWFFLYVVVQGISISLIANPSAWFTTSGVFLFFAAGFYYLNLREIDRKQKAGVMTPVPLFVNWQKQRLVELPILGILSLIAGILIRNWALLTVPAAVVAFFLAVWQIVVTERYRSLRFIETGV